MILAQISDMHVTARGKLWLDRLDTGAMLEACVAHIIGLLQPPDVILATGDLAAEGEEDEYRRLHDLLSPLKFPVYLIPGNHDDRTRLKRVFADYGGFGDCGNDKPRLDYVIDDHPLRLVALDTIIPGVPGGEVTPAQLSWLDETLGQQPERPTLIAMHHPPFISGIRHMDAMNCANSEALESVIARHAQVERILCGHLHRATYVRWAGTIVATAPSTCFQVALNLESDSRAEWIMEPPAYLVHYWKPDTGLVTHTDYIGDFAGPELFPWSKGLKGLEAGD